MSEASRRSAAARGLRIGGALLAERLPPDAYAFVWPPLAFSFALDGILLVPLGFTAFHCAGGVLRGERWATVLGLASSIVVLILSPTVVVVMGTGYFSAPAFLVATLVVAAAGLAMTVPLLRLGRHAAV